MHLASCVPHLTADTVEQHSKQGSPLAASGGAAWLSYWLSLICLRATMSKSDTRRCAAWLVSLLMCGARLVSAASVFVCMYTSCKGARKHQACVPRMFVCMPTSCMGTGKDQACVPRMLVCMYTSCRAVTHKVLELWCSNKFFSLCDNLRGVHVPAHLHHHGKQGCAKLASPWQRDCTAQVEGCGQLEHLLLTPLRTAQVRCMKRTLSFARL